MGVGVDPVIQSRALVIVCQQKQIFKHYIYMCVCACVRACVCACVTGILCMCYVIF